MNLKYRTLTLLLTVAMLLTFMPAMAFAEPAENEGQAAVSSTGISVTGFNATPKTAVKAPGAGIATISFTVEAPEGKHIAEVRTNIVAESGNNPVYDFNSGYSIDGDGSNTANISFTMTPVSFTTYHVAAVEVSLSEGDIAYFKNSKYDTPLYGDKDVINVDMSGADVAVTPGTGDTSSPTLTGKASFEKTSVTKGEPVLVGIEASDDSGIEMVTVSVGKKGSTLSETYTVNGLFQKVSEFTVDGVKYKGVYFMPSSAGEYQIQHIEVYDGYWNRSVLYNSKWNGAREYTGDNVMEADLDAANITVVDSGDQGESDAPELVEGSLSIAKKKISLNEGNTLSMKFKDDSDIQIVEVKLFNSLTKTFHQGGMGLYNEQTGAWEAAIPESRYYGTWTIYYITATDKSGNTLKLADKKNIKEGDTFINTIGGKTQWTDLSDLTYLCGIEDASSKVFVTGDGFEQDPTNVEDAPALKADKVDSGEALTEIKEKFGKTDSAEGCSFYQIGMTGEYSKNGESVKVLIPENGNAEDSVVKITHLIEKEGGAAEVQTRYSKVDNGDAEINVYSFSPFMVERVSASDLPTGAVVDPDPVRYILSKSENSKRSYSYNDKHITFAEGDKVEVFNDLSNAYDVYEYGTIEGTEGFYCGTKALDKEIHACPESKSIADTYTSGQTVSVNVYCDGSWVPCDSEFKYTFTDSDIPGGDDDEEFDTAQENALNALQKVADNINAYDIEDRAEILDAIEAAIDNIYEAKSIEEINTAKAEADRVINSKKTTAQKAEEARAAEAKRQADAEAAAAAAKAEADRLEWNGTFKKSIPAVKGVKVKAAKKKVTISWTKASNKNLKKFDKVEIQVCTDKGFARANTKRVEVKKSKKSHTVKGLANKKTYYVRVRDVKGSGTGKFVSKWTKAKKIKVK